MMSKVRKKFGSAVAESVRGALPLRDVVRDHAGGLHRGLAELGIAGDFALNALALGMQKLPQTFELGNQVVDLRKRGSRNALDQRVDVVDDGFRALLGGAIHARGGTAQIGNVVANEIADAGFELRSCNKIIVFVGVFNFFRTKDTHRLFPCFACVASTVIFRTSQPASGIWTVRS